MNDLHRDLAPLSESAWATLEEAVRDALVVQLAARKLVDVEGPLGWSHGALATGRVAELDGAPADGVQAHRREVLPLVELRAGFRLARAEVEALERGAADADVDPALEAAARIARAEDRLVFHGFPAAGMRGIAEASPHVPLEISRDYTSYPAVVAEAVEALRSRGVGGRVAVALGPRCYTGLMKATDPSGYPVLSRLRNMLDGPLVRAPAVDGAVVLSLRGGDFRLVLGRDLSIGYRGHDGSSVELYLVESLAFRAVGPEAAVPLVYPAGAP